MMHVCGEHKLLAEIFTHIVINIPAISSDVYVDKSTVDRVRPCVWTRINPPHGNRRPYPKNYNQFALEFTDVTRHSFTSQLAQIWSKGHPWGWGRPCLGHVEI